MATTQATLDGVVDPVGQWVQPDGDHGEYSFERQARSGGLVLDRKTFEGLAGYWPSQSGRWADMVKPLPKDVGPNTLSGDLEWNATLLEGDIEDAIPKLKAAVDGDLFMHGSEPARLGRRQRPRARRQANRPDGAGGREAVRVRRGSPHLPSGLTATNGTRPSGNEKGPVSRAFE